eukprot:3071330-Pyramimonas_sp.AAC.1
MGRGQGATRGFSRRIHTLVTPVYVFHLVGFGPCIAGEFATEGGQLAAGGGESATSGFESAVRREGIAIGGGNFTARRGARRGDFAARGLAVVDAGMGDQVLFAIRATADAPRPLGSLENFGGESTSLQ